MIAPSAGKRACAAVGRYPDAVDPGAADDRDAPAALGAGAEDGEGVVPDARCVAAQPRSVERMQRLLLLGRGSRRRRAATSPRSHDRQRPRPALARRAPRRAAPRARASAPSSTEVVGRAERPAHGGEQVAVARGRARGRSSSCRRRPRARPRRSRLHQLAAARRSAAISASRSVVGDQSWPISGCVRAAPSAPSPASPLTAARGGQPLVRRDVLDEAEQLGRERRAGAGAAPLAPDASRAPRRRRRRPSPASVPPLRTSTTVDVAVAGGERGDQRRSRPRCRTRRRAARAARASRPAAGSRVHARAARARSPPTTAARGTPSSCSREHRVVARRSSGGSRTGRRRARASSRAQARRRRRARRRARPAAAAARPRRRAAAARTHVRWLRPTWSTTHARRLDVEQRAQRSAGARSRRCRGRPRGGRASSSARVTIPTGFVKSTIHASGAAQLADARRRSSSTTGTVRSALANPPAPVVSLPDAAARRAATVSSDSRAAWPPTRIWSRTKSAPSTARSRSSGRRRARRRRPAASSIRRASPPTTSRRSGVDVVQHELVDVDPRARPRPGHELGRVGRAAADDCDLHPFTPVSVTPSTNALCARKKSDDRPAAITSSVAAIVRFHCTWCSVAELRQPDRERPSGPGSRRRTGAAGRSR